MVGKENLNSYGSHIIARINEATRFESSFPTETRLQRDEASFMSESLTYHFLLEEAGQLFEDESGPVNDQEVIQTEPDTLPSFEQLVCALRRA